MQIIFAVGISAFADDWPQWRGWNRNAVSRETGLIDSWGEAGPAIGWQATGIGEGYSSVVISNGRVFTTGRIEGDVYCFAIDLQTGDQQWARKIGTTTRNVMATPSVHDELVYALDPDGDLACLNVADGAVIWQKSFLQDFDGKLMSGRGYGESPLIDGDWLICTPGGAHAMIVALDRKTGEVIWKSALPEIGEQGSDGAAFSSIAILQVGGSRQYVQLVGRGLIGVDAGTGRFLWGYNDIANSTANIPTPIVRGDMVFSANGYHAGGVLLQISPDKSGDGFMADEVYRLRGNKFQNHHGGFVLVGDHIFGGHGSNNGLPTCIEFQTGKIAWKQRGPGTGSASVVAADGHLYFHYQDGVVALIEANSDEYRLKQSFKLPNAGGDSWSHPVIADGRLFLREQDELRAYDLRGAGNVEPPTTPTTAPPEFAQLQGQAVTIAFVGGQPDADPWRMYDLVFVDAHGQIPVVTLSNRHINANGSLNAAVVSELQKLNSEFCLNVAGTRITIKGIQQAVAMKQLAGLSVELCPHIDDAALAPVRNANNLQLLIATGTSIGPVGLAQLTELPKLVALNLELCDNVTDGCCDALAGIKSLRTLVLRKTGFEPDRITAAGVQKLSALQSLEVLNLYGNAINDESLAQLSKLRNLRGLDLSLTPISDAGLPHLTSLTKLSHLTLLYSEGFAGPKITDAGLKPLSMLSQLSTLNLVGAIVTDDGVNDLKRLRKLRHLTLVGSQISDAGLQELQESLPDCEISSDRQATTPD